MDDALLQFAHELADAAAAITLPAFRSAATTFNKSSDGAFDPVTQADKDAEAAMRQLIANRYPDHAILGEEYDEKPGNDYQWIIDPIDGTRAFITGIPVWGTLIALNHKTIPQLGIIDQPFTGERYFAGADKAAFLRHNGQTRQLHTRPCAALRDAILATTTPALFENTPAEAVWNRVRAQTRLTRYGGDCYNYALLAAGHIDAVIEQGLRPFDIAALIPLVEAAGGIITDWQGEQLSNKQNREQNRGQVLACGDPVLHAALLEYVAD